MKTNTVRAALKRGEAQVGTWLSLNSPFAARFMAQVLQRADLGAGEMYDVLQKRDLALSKYQAVVANNASTPPAEIARKRIKEAYREN